MATNRNRLLESESADNQLVPGDYSKDGERSVCWRRLQEGSESVAGAARLSIAAVEDMLSGKLTPQEAAVVNTATGRVLKACELHLKYSKRASDRFCLPKPGEKEE